MLKVHILNVNHGDSIILEFQSEDKKAYGVIDSNKVGTDLPPALMKLDSLGAESISFIALTHPDYDHYHGMFEIIDAYKDRIETFYSFPIGSYIEGRLKKIAGIYTEIIKSSDSPFLITRHKEIISILWAVKKYVGLDNWEEPTGFFNVIKPPGFEDVEVVTILPHALVKGNIFNLIESGSFDFCNRSRESSKFINYFTSL